MYSHHVKNIANPNKKKTDLRPKYTTWLIIYDLSASLAVLKKKKSEMYDVNTNVIFRMILGFV